MEQLSKHIDYLKIIPHNVLFKWLSNPHIHNGYVVPIYTSDYEIHDKNRIFNTFITSPRESTLNSILNKKLVNRFITDIISNVLSDWQTDYGSKPIYDAINDSSDIFDMLDKYVHDFTIKPNELVYRGLHIHKHKLNIFASRTNKFDWKRIIISGAIYFMYTKQRYTYNPHRSVQSWTISKASAESFSINNGNSCIIVALADSSFKIGPNAFKVYDSMSSFNYEREVVHFGANLKVLLCVEDTIFNELKFRGEPKHDKLNFDALSRNALRATK